MEEQNTTIVNCQNLKNLEEIDDNTQTPPKTFSTKTFKSKSSLKILKESRLENSFKKFSFSLQKVENFVKNQKKNFLLKNIFFSNWAGIRRNPNFQIETSSMLILSMRSEKIRLALSEPKKRKKLKAMLMTANLRFFIRTKEAFTVFKEIMNIKYYKYQRLKNQKKQDFNRKSGLKLIKFIFCKFLALHYRKFIFQCKTTNPNYFKSIEFVKLINGIIKNRLLHIVKKILRIQFNDKVKGMIIKEFSNNVLNILSSAIKN